jgi:ABC-type antimicrobial peptide transport system permease subunit
MIQPKSLHCYGVTAVLMVAAAIIALSTDTTATNVYAQNTTKNAYDISQMGMISHTIYSNTLNILIPRTKSKYDKREREQQQ